LGGAARHRGRRDAAPGGPRGRGAAVSAPSPAGSRRATMIAAVAAAIGAIAVWSSTRLTWVSYTEDDGLTRATEGTMDGAQWHAALAPLALVMIAGMAAMFADRKSTRLNSSHVSRSYAVFCLNKKTIKQLNSL